MADFLPCCLIILLLVPLPLPSAQNAAITVPIGASIIAAQDSNPWRSPSRNFAFGFQHLPDNKDLFVLSIWFDKIPDKTIVWYENSSYPVPRGSTVRLDAVEGIVLQDPQQRSLFTSSSLKGRTRVANGFMNDTGNFVLQGNDSTLVWESFKDPKDTILPTQILEINGSLISRFTSTNFSRGKFYGEMHDAGNFMLHTRSFPTINTVTDDTYYSTETSDQNNASINSGFQLVFEESGQLSIVKRNGKRVALSSRANPSAAEYYYRATLDYDGLFSQYYYPKKFSGNSSWATADAWPKNVCNMDGTMGSGACGYNSVCKLVNLRPVCQCPKGFSLANPNNSFSDCKPNHAVYCASVDQKGSPDDGYELVEIQDTVWPSNNYESIKPSTEEECRNFCLNDCFCGAVGFETDQCWKKRLPLTNGRIDTALGAKAFLKLRKGNYTASSFPINPNCPPPGKLKKVKGTSMVVVAALLGSSILINCLLFGAGCLGYNYIYRNNFVMANNTSVSNLCCFSYKSLVRATKGFTEELGRGSFGIVYRGVIPDASKSIVAVKKLDRVAQDMEKEFKAEVNVIGQTHHKNLVSLIGFCDEGPHRLLVYEYMSNGTLADFLFGDVRPSWGQRMEAALGIARGLTYLHEECKTQIIHCDVKPQNILLDEFYNAHISDFGLAKALMRNQSKTLTNIRGTKGYVAPEWFNNAQITAKVDVYSFGIVLLEIITCRKSVNQGLEYEDELHPILIDWVWECFVEGTVENLVEDEEALSDIRTLKRNVMIGIWCIRDDASMRPTMRKACQMLEGIVEVEVPPCP